MRARAPGDPRQVLGVGVLSVDDVQQEPPLKLRLGVMHPHLDAAVKVASQVGAHLEGGGGGSSRSGGSRLGGQVRGEQVRGQF